MHPLAPLKTFRADAAAVSDDFSTTKRDKRLMKHSSFLSRVADSGVAKKAKTQKRTGRGRSQKLATTMEGLADALPELEHGGGGAEALQGKIRHKSIKSKKGALKRKELVVKGEMERFGNSMAQMATTTQEGTGNSSSSSGGGSGSAAMGRKSTGPDRETAPTSAAASNRWAALRGYISSTMEQNPAFAGQQ